MVQACFVLLDLLLEVCLAALNALQLVLHLVLVLLALAKVVARSESHAVLVDLFSEANFRVSNVIHLVRLKLDPKVARKRGLVLLMVT